MRCLYPWKAFFAVILMLFGLCDVMEGKFLFFGSDTYPIMESDVLKNAPLNCSITNERGDGLNRANCLTVTNIPQADKSKNLPCQLADKLSNISKALRNIVEIKDDGM